MKDLKQKLRMLPKEPGVYLYKNKAKNIIYVGKASVLKNRVSSYFRSPEKLDTKTWALVAEITDIDWIITKSEIDALFLESELVKRYHPKYNILLQDDKHYLYIKITTYSKAPTLSYVRRPLDDDATYYGPFLEGFAVRKALRLLRKIFPYNTHQILPKRVCLQYHLGLCPGLEESKTNLAEYKSNLKKLGMFLKGERSLLVKQLEKDMRLAASKHEYERAASLRNQAGSLRALGKQIVFGDVERFDLTRDQALSGLVGILDLNSIPRRIETYDISHISGSNNVASMVVFLDGIAAKGEYRKFKMQTPGNDDFAHMREVILRRFSGKNIEKWAKPDLLVIDGGKGQLSSALSSLAELGVNIPAIGLAKRLEEIIKFKDDNFEKILLPRNSHSLKLLMRMRDEAHRFAVAYHSLLRSKKQTISELDEIPGIGPITRKKLIKHFGSLQKLKGAKSNELIGVVGAPRAQVLQEYLSQ